jgi:hypothetical protein
MKRLLTFGTYIFVLMALSVPTFGIDLSQSLDKAAIAYEEQAVLTVTVQWPGSQIAYLFDRPVQPTLEKLQVQRFATSVSSQQAATGEVTSKTFTFTLVPSGSGTARIEPMTIHYISWPDSIPGELTTSAMTLTVAAARPVAKPGSLFGMLPVWGWIAVWAGVAALFAARIMLFVRGRKKPVEEKKSPIDLALESLSQIQAESGSDLKRFQTGLYKLLLTFAQEQLGLETSGRSAEEVTMGIQASKLSESEKEKLCGWILRADREKFTPLPPAPGETIRLEAEIRNFFESMQLRK